MSDYDIHALVQRWISPAPDGKAVFNIHPDAAELLTEDAVWHMPPSNPLGDVRGREAIMKIQTLAKSVYQWDTIALRPIRVIVEGDQAVAFYEITCRQVIDGEPYACQYAHFLTFRDGKICDIVDLFDSLSWYRQSGRKLESVP